MCDAQATEMEPYAFKPKVFTEVETNPGGDYVCNSVSPEPRSGHRTVCDDANLYAFGGYSKTSSIASSQHRLFEELWCFNFAEGRWKLLPTTGQAPKELASHCAILYGNFLFVFGGTGVTFGESSSNTLHSLDLRCLKWEEVTTVGEPPPPMYGQAVIFDDSRKCIYVIGGTTGFDFSMDIHKIDLRNKEWELIYACTGDQSEPTPRYRHEVGFGDNKIYVFGGGTSVDAYPLKTVPTFNLETKKWRTLKTRRSNGNTSTSEGGEQEEERAVHAFPPRRKCYASVQMGDYVYISGGCNASTVYDDIWKFHIPTKQWHYLPISLPVPLSFHTASLTSEGCMYIFGGVTNIAKGIRTNKVFKIWLRIPKLREICWEALLHYRKEIRTSTRDDIVNQLGIPMDFARRVHPSPPGGKPDASVETIWESDLLQPRNSTSVCDAPTVPGCINSFT